MKISQNPAYIRNTKQEVIQFRDIRDLMPRGYAKDVADRFHVSNRSVYNIAAGRQKNALVYLSLLKIAAEQKNRISECKAMMDFLQVSEPA